MAEYVADIAGSILGKVQTSWLFRDRTWTKKQYLEYDHSESVHIYEQSTSPARVIQMWVLAAIVYAVTVGLWYDILNTVEQDILLLVLIPVATALTGVTVAFTVVGVSGWFQRYFTETCCTYCDTAVTYPHSFREGGLGNKRTYRFCSKDCREQWEREFVEYPFSGYYDIQDEETERRVECEHYSSAYEVQHD
jgi:hypothetical protein